MSRDLTVTAGSAMREMEEVADDPLADFGQAVRKAEELELRARGTLDSQGASVEDRYLQSMPWRAGEPPDLDLVAKKTATPSAAASTATARERATADNGARRLPDPDRPLRNDGGPQAQTGRGAGDCRSTAQRGRGEKVRRAGKRRAGGEGEGTGRRRRQQRRRRADPDTARGQGKGPVEGIAGGDRQDDRPESGADGAQQRQNAERGMTGYSELAGQEASVPSMHICYLDDRQPATNCMTRRQG